MPDGDPKKAAQYALEQARQAQRQSEQALKKLEDNSGQEAVQAAEQLRNKGEQIKPALEKAAQKMQNIRQDLA